MTYIVASLVEGSLSGVSRSSRKAFSQGADLVEVRLDHLRLARLDEAALSAVREAVRGPAIATLRSKPEGGVSGLKGRTREKALRAVLGAGFEYVDMELEQDHGLISESRRKRLGPALIASSHLDGPVPERSVRARLRKACRSGDIGKVAMPCVDAAQAIMLARIGMKASVEGERFALIGMGDQGQLTRACARQMGSAMVFCAMPGRAAAPGQLELEEQMALYDDRVVLGLVGHPVSHSVSKPMQEAALRKAGIAGMFLNLDIPPESFTKEALEALGALGVKGVNVTVPHKQSAFSMCDGVGPDAAETEAVNTVTFDNARIQGENTDLIGFTRAIEAKTDIGPGTDALVVGAGGAARAAAVALARAGAHVTVAARDPRKGRRTSSALGVESVALTALRGGRRRFDIVVNCTPVGTKGLRGAAPVPPNLFRKGVLFFDMVYNPPVTRMMRTASSRGAKSVGGLEMLVQQGAESFARWTGTSPDVDAMRSAARRALS